VTTFVSWEAMGSAFGELLSIETSQWSHFSSLAA